MQTRIMLPWPAVALTLDSTSWGADMYSAMRIAGTDVIGTLSRNENIAAKILLLVIIPVFVVALHTTVQLVRSPKAFEYAVSLTPNRRMILV